MLSRIDHPIIAVRDLDLAVDTYTRLGFDVMRGGRNPGLGTFNALIRFGLEYLELLSVEDRETAARVHPRGREIVAYLDAHPGGLLSFVVASDGIDQDVARAEAHGFFPGQPVAMQRSRPDGNILRWRLLIPCDVSFRQPWPLLIQWDTPDRVRLEWEQPGVHINGAYRLTGIALVVQSLAAATELYGRQLGLPVGPVEPVVELGAEHASVGLDGCPIDLLTPTSDGPVAAALESEGQGPYHVRLGVRDLDATRQLLEQRGFAVESVWPAGLAVRAEKALGARLVFQEVR
jgi:catechol 2,3-dioxygenase-like lactoylglutathione lyase family enzyme